MENRKEIINLYQSAYKMGEIVYLVTDADKLGRMITSIQFRYGSTKPLYLLSFNTTETWHYDIEFSYNKSYVNM